ncbi:RluA family pseudouridine synthase [bacterium]|nr:RluA family pseudouridine synthase [bacterium]
MRLRSDPYPKIKVLYEDNHLLALFKPAGIPTQGDITGDLSLLDWARRWVGKKYAKPGAVYIGLVHRIDRPVQGVVVFARTSKAAARLSEQFRNHTVRKTYLAVIHEVPKKPEGDIMLYLAKGRGKSLVASQDDPRAKLAGLHYRVIDSVTGFCLVEVDPITGRHHQIRASLAQIGHPILGDIKYGSPARINPGAIALLASTITCRHPTRDMTITIESPLPQDWPWPPSRA